MAAVIIRRKSLHPRYTPDGVIAILHQGGGGAAVKARLEQGAEVDEKDSLGNTALIWAAWKGYREMVQLLVDAGADIETANTGGRTALGAARKSGYTEIVQLLETAATQQAAEKARTATAGRQERLKQLAQKKLKIRRPAP